MNNTIKYNEKLCKIYYGEGENDYIRRYLKNSDILTVYKNELENIIIKNNL